MLPLLTNQKKQNKSGAKAIAKKFTIDIWKKTADKLKDSKIFNDLADKNNAYAARREEPLLKGKDTLWKVKYELNLQPGFKIYLTCEDVADFSEPTKIMHKLLKKKRILRKNLGDLIWEENKNPSDRNKSINLGLITSTE